jgi:hypothetical protein
MFYVTSRNPDRYGEFAASIRRVGKLAFWLALSAIFGLLYILMGVMYILVSAQPRTFPNILWSLRLRAIGYVLRVFFSFSQD